MTTAGHSLPGSRTAASTSGRGIRTAVRVMSSGDARPPLDAHPDAAAARAPVVGRDDELAVAEAFLTSAAQRFAVLVVEGEAGIGKTTVWREIARRADERGFRVLAARPAEAETKLALSAVADLLGGLPAAAFAALPEPQQRALDVALLRAGVEGAPPDPRTVATAVRSLLALLGRERPLLLAIDDVQWLDSASANVLDFALRRLTAERVGWLLALRAGERSRLAADASVADAAPTRATLGPVTVAALHHVLEARLDGPLSRAALVRIHAASGGNPFYALEIARAGGSAQARAAGDPLPLPASLRELLAQRIPALSPEARAALLAAAALSHPSVELVEAAATAEGLAAAEEAGLVRVDGARVTFTHPLYASAVYGAAATRRRREMHRRLAELVGDREEHARHLAVATSAADECVAGALEDGAALARSRGAWGSAAELLERAAALTPPGRPGHAARRAILGAEYHVYDGDRVRGRTLVEGVLGRPLPRPLRADALRLRADIASNADNHEEAARLYEQALACADDPRLAGMIELGLCYVTSVLMQPRAACGHARRALELVERAGDRALTASALAACAMSEHVCGHGVDWDIVDRAVALEDPGGLVPVLRRPTTMAALLRLYVGLHAEAREGLHAVWADATDRGDESDLPFVLLWLSWLETRSGELAAAASVAAEATSLATLTGTRSTHPWVMSQQAYVQAHLGAVEETRRLCAEAATPSERSGSALPLVWTAASLAVLELSLGDPGAAWAACEPIVVALEAHGIGEPVVCFFLPDALEALIGLGELDRAEKLIDAFEARGRELDRMWALATGGRCRGLLLAARGDLDAAGAALDGALAEHRRIDMPFELARTLLVGGVVERRARKRARAKASFEQALELFDVVGAPLWAARARAELDRVGVRRATDGQLTAGERRVAELAAQGLTNREAAAVLFISPKTVAANLARVYRKLGITSRAELGARIAPELQPSRET